MTWRRALASLIVASACGACGGGQVARLARPLKPLPERSNVYLYPAALRLAALGRVHQRAGADMLAGEYFRAAYRAHPALSFILDYALSCERSRQFAEAHQAYIEALNHQLPDKERERIQSEAERLKTLVSPSLVQVSIQVEPERTRVTLERKDDAGPASSRLVLGDGTIYLKPGTYELHGAAEGYTGQDRTFRIGMYDRQMLTIRLRPVERDKIRIAGPEHLGPAPRGPRTKGAAGERGRAAERRGTTGRRVADRTPVEGGGERPGRVRAGGQDEPAAEESPGEAVEGEQRPAVAERDEPAEAEGEERPAATEQDGPAGQAPGAEEPDAGIEEPPARGPPSLVGPMITTGVGLLGLGAAGYFGYMAKTYAGYANEANPKSKNYDKIFNEQSDLARSNATLATWTAIGGGAVVAAGTVWWILAATSGSWAHNDASGRPALAVLPGSLGQGGRGLIATWRF